MSHDQSTDDFIIIASEVNAKTYTVSGLVYGNTYQFKVEAHNAIGYGAASTPFAIIAATNPSTPDAPVTVVDGENVKISWELPFNGGSTITGYVIKIR